MVVTPAVAGSGSLPIPPISPYGNFHGSLFTYKNNLAAFESLPPPVPPLPANTVVAESDVNKDSSNDGVVVTRKKCILIGGLSDGLIPTPYAKELETHCHELGWSLVQPIISSSYLGFGIGSLQRDTEEISALLWYLACHRSADTFAIIGHSTGCQNAVHFLKHGTKEMIERTKVVVLQAPVSDREHAMTEPNYEENIECARKIVVSSSENDVAIEEMMPRSAFWAPITAKRFLDLQQKGGADDFFSSDYTNEELKDRLGHIGLLSSSDLQLLVAFSGSDEYVPSHVNTKELTQRLCTAMNQEDHNKDVAQPLYLPDANHNLSQAEGDINIFVKKIGELLQNVK